MPGMIAAGICRYGHSILGARDLLIKRDNSAACLHCYRLALAEKDHIAESFMIERSSRPETEWVDATIRKAVDVGGYTGTGWPVGK